MSIFFCNSFFNKISRIWRGADGFFTKPSTLAEPKTPEGQTEEKTGKCQKYSYLPNNLPYPKAANNYVLISG